MSQQARIAVSVPAGGTANNILSGQTVEQVTNAGVVQIGLTVPAGTVAGSILANVIIGGRQVVSNFIPIVESAAGVGPIADRDIVINAPVVPGNRILINLSSSAAGAVVVTAYVNLPAQG